MDVNGMIENLAASVPAPREGDYMGLDGLLYCRKCKTAVQCRINVLGRERVVPCICKCEAERRQQEKEEAARRELMLRISDMRKVGFPDSEMQSWTFAADDRSNGKLTKALYAYVENFDTFRKSGKGLLLWGNVGTGKTFAAACVANALIDKCYPVLMTNFARLSNTLQGMYAGKQEYIDGLDRFSLLIIDDLAAERKTEYMQEIIFNIIDSRYRSGLPMIITTNLTLEEIKNPANVSDARCYDRILERCFPIEVSGASQRRKKIIADYEKTKELLQL